MNADLWIPLGTVVLCGLVLLVWPDNGHDGELRHKYLLFLNPHTWHEEGEILEIMQRFRPELTHNQHHRILYALMDQGLVEKRTIQPGETLNGMSLGWLIATYYKLKEVDGDDTGKFVPFPSPA